MKKKLALFVFLLSILFPLLAFADIGTVSLPNGTLSETPAFVKDKSSSTSSSSSSDGLTLPNSGNTGASSSIVKPSPSENKDPLEKITDDTLKRSSDVVGANANQGVADSVKETQKKQEEAKSIIESKTDDTGVLDVKFEDIKVEERKDMSLKVVKEITKVIARELEGEFGKYVADENGVTREDVTFKDLEAVENYKKEQLEKFEREIAELEAVFTFREN